MRNTLCVKRIKILILGCMREIVGKNIRRIRKAKGLTINALATLSDSDVGNLSRLERGKQGFSDVTLGKIAQALETDPVDFFDKTFGVVQTGAPAVVPAPAPVDPLQERMARILATLKLYPVALRSSALDALEGWFAGYLAGQGGRPLLEMQPGSQIQGGGRAKKNNKNKAT